MRKRHIGSSLLIAILLLSSLLSLSIGTIGYYFYYEGMLGKTNDYAESVINLVVKNINTEAFMDAVTSKERTEEIIKIEKACDDIKQTHDVEFLYIIRPISLNPVNNMRYVLTGETLDDRNKGFRVENGQLSGEEYSPDVVRKYFEVMRSEGELIFFTNTTSFGYMYTGMKAVLDKYGRPIAVVATDINMDEIHAFLNSYLMMITIGALGITIFFIIIMYFWLYRRIVYPVNSIEKSANDFVNLSHRGVSIEELTYNKPDIKTKDEIESLSNSIDVMSKDLKNYMVNMIQVEGEKNRIAGELNVATRIQSSMLPCIFPPFPDDKRFEIYATMNPAKEVGGDFYDFFMVDEKHIAIVVADVSGKGIPAALFMVIGKTLIKDHSSAGCDLGKVFEEVNQILCESNSEELFITAFEAVINLETGHVSYVNAGHEMPYIYRNGKEWNPYEMKAAFVLAGMEGMKYKAGEFTLEHGDRIFQYTDGVTEATSIKNELYGMDRLKKALDSNIDKNPEGLLKAVKADIDKFVGEAPQFDDITMLSLYYK